MNLEKTFVVTLKDGTQVDVSFVVEKSDVHYQEEYDSQYSYDESGLSELQTDELENFVTANIDAWLEDVVAEHEEQQEQDDESWDDAYEL
jgi:hypothetical protein